MGRRKESSISASKRAKSMSGWLSRVIVFSPGWGGVQGFLRGSGTIATGMPRFRSVDLVVVGAADINDGMPMAESRAAGSEDEIMGLFVRRLWISGFFCRLVTIPVGSLSSSVE